MIANCICMDEARKTTRSTQDDDAGPPISVRFTSYVVQLHIFS